MMEALLLSLVSAAIGVAITIGVQRYQATWLKRRDTAVDAYGATVAVHSAVVSSLVFARRIEAKYQETRDIQEIAESCDWHLRGHLDASKVRLDKLREARLNVLSIWGADVARLFDDFFELTSAWHNALGTFRDGIHGQGPDDSIWDEDATGFKWDEVIAGTAPHAEAFERALENMMDIIRRFARSTGVVITELLALPQGVRDVVADYEEYRARLPIQLPTGRPVLPSRDDR